MFTCFVQGHHALITCDGERLENNVFQRSLKRNKEKMNNAVKFLLKKHRKFDDFFKSNALSKEKMYFALEKGKNRNKVFKTE